MSTDTVYTPEMMRAFLVKFHFKQDQERLIPHGIPEVERDSVKAMDRRHAERAEAEGYGERGEIGRKRPDRTDTGDDFHLTNVRFAYGDSLYIVGYHKHFQAGKPAKGRQREKKSVWVVTLCYATDQPENPLEISSETLDGIKELQDRAWQICDIWSNPNLMGTLNFKGLNDNLPEHAVSSYTLGTADPKG